MKKQTFYKQRQLKSQKSLENITKNNNFNYQDSPYNQPKNSGKKNNYYNNIENSSNNKINRNNISNNNNNNNSGISKKGKIGGFDYEIEPRNIFLIPDNYNIDVNNLKLCEKELLPKEKNYFISEKNFQLLKDTLNEKEEMIKELNYLLEKYKNQNNNKILNNYKNDEKIKNLEEENKNLEKANDELILQIEKKNIYFNKMYQLLQFVFKNNNYDNNYEIKKFIKDQDLEILFDRDELERNTNINNQNPNNDLIDILFKTNKDMIINDLENYKKKYKDLRRQLNYITNMKYSENDKNNDNNNNDKSQMIIEHQKKLNELY